MPLLNELINEIYSKTMDEKSRSEATDTGPNATLSGQQHDARIERLSRVLCEMGQLLSQADQPCLDEAPPSEQITLRILSHWEQLTSSAIGIQEHMNSLENDIARMQPWGDFDVMKVEQLAARGVHIHFWRIAIGELSKVLSDTFLSVHQARIISQDSEWVYFVTVDSEDHPKQVPENAVMVDICPCPVSTLIMLQTRDKDTLRNLETLRGDYALAHYGEVYAALRNLLPAGTPMPQLAPEHKTLKQKIRHLFAK